MPEASNSLMVRMLRELHAGAFDDGRWLNAARRTPDSSPDRALEAMIDRFAVWRSSRFSDGGI